MSELLAPAGNMDALKAAIANGADAVYLGLQKFGARAYSNNFDEETLPQAVDYAHLRGVRVYATMNTIVFQDELPEAIRQLHFLNQAGVDGVIVQDLALLTYMARTFQHMEAHCSTQLGIDDLPGALLVKRLGAKRTVIGREVPLDQVKRIRQQADLPVEAFVHGALCVSYSGNCIMSGMTGNRLGNRGRCIGSCRKLYQVQDAATGRTLGQSYLLSTKDLCTINHVEELAGIDSLKIEGRMKEPAYVANVVSRYRMALDGTATPQQKELLNRTFNRTFTKGYILGEDLGEITNVEKPNNYGFQIGEISGFRKGMCQISLTSPLNQNDVIRIRHKDQDVNLSVARLYDAQGNLINGAHTTCYIKVKERLSAGDAVYKTKDVAYAKELEGRLTGEFRRFPLDVTVYAYPGAPLVVDARGLGQSCTYTGEDPLDEATNAPTDLAAVTKQLGRLNETVFQLGHVDLQTYNAFVPAKLLNAARKAVVQQLYQLKLASKPRDLKPGAGPESSAFLAGESTGNPDPAAALAAAAWGLGGGAGAAAGSAATAGALAEAASGGPAACAAHATRNAAAAPGAADSGAARPAATPDAAPPLTFAPQPPVLTAYCTTEEQAQAAQAAGLDVVYHRNVVPRNGAEYPALEGPVLVGGLGGVQHYAGANPLVTDYSLNVVNAQSVALLHGLGATRVTLSYELNQGQIQDLLASYQQLHGGLPQLEMIVYGRAPLLVTKHCPLKRMGLCGTCRTHRYQIKDEYGTFPLLSHSNCNTTVLNGKVLNLMDEMPRLNGIAAFRLQFTTEDAATVAQVIAQAQAKLAGSAEKTFDPQTQTRGFFRKEIL